MVLSLYRQSETTPKGGFLMFEEFSELFLPSSEIQCHNPCDADIIKYKHHIAHGKQQRYAPFSQFIHFFKRNPEDVNNHDIRRNCCNVEKYGFDTTRGQMRCMRKLALMLGMKDKIKIFYDGQAILVS